MSRRKQHVKKYKQRSGPNCEIRHSFHSRMKKKLKRKLQNIFVESLESNNCEPPSKIAGFLLGDYHWNCKCFVKHEFRNRSQTFIPPWEPEKSIFIATEKSRMQVKLYQAFWNNKAEDICSSQGLKQYLPGEIQGAMNVVLEDRESQIHHMGGCRSLARCGPKISRTFGKKSLQIQRKLLKEIRS